MSATFASARLLVSAQRKTSKAFTAAKAILLGFMPARLLSFPAVQYETREFKTHGLALRKPDKHRKLAKIRPGTGITMIAEP